MTRTILLVLAVIVGVSYAHPDPMARDLAWFMTGALSCHWLTRWWIVQTEPLAKRLLK